MLRFIAGRLIVVLSVGLTLSIVTFFLLNYVIDPAQAIAGEDALFEEIEQIREQYGFDRRRFSDKLLLEQTSNFFTYR